MSTCGALNCTDATRLTLCPARVVSLSCPLFIRSAPPVPVGSRRCGADARERLTRIQGARRDRTAPRRARDLSSESFDSAMSVIFHEARAVSYARLRN
jgi:hypothetical protein